MKRLKLLFLLCIYSISLNAQDCSLISLTLIEDPDKCLPFSQWKFEGEAPLNSEVSWTCSSISSSITIDDEDPLKATITLYEAGVHQVMMSVTLPDGSECSEDFQIETFETITPITNLQNTYTLCDNSIIVPIDIENAEDFSDITLISGDNIETGSSSDFSFVESGTETIYIQTEDINSCSSNQENTIEIQEGPSYGDISANLTPSINNLDCLDPGSTHQLSAAITTSSFEATGILWDYNNELTTTNHTFDVTVGNNDIYIYNISILFDDGCAIDYNLLHNYTIEYESTFSTSFNGNDLCPNETITLTNTSPHLGWDSDFSWNIENAEIISESPSAINFSYSEDGTYDWQLNYNGECSSSYEETVNVNLATNASFPDISIDSENITSCELPYNLNVMVNSQNIDDLSYNWELNFDNVTIYNSILENLEYQILDPGSYELTLEAIGNDFNCPTRDTILIAIDTLNLIFNIDSITECENYIFSPMDFATNSLGSTVSYIWEIIREDGTVFSSSSSENPSIEMSEPGTFDLSIDLSSNISNCDTSILFENIIEINESPSINLSMDGVIDVCEFPYEITVEDTSDYAGDFSWYLENQNGLLISETNEPFEFNFETTGSYNLIWENIDSISLCFSSQELTINMDSLDINLNSSDAPYSVYCDPYEFSTNAINLTGNLYGDYSYVWELIDPIENQVYESITNGSFTLPNIGNGNFDLQVTLSNEDGSCMDEVTVDNFLNFDHFNLSLEAIQSSNCIDDQTGIVEKTLLSTFDAPNDLNTSYNWQITPSNNVNIISSSPDSIKYSFTNAGSYTISYSASIEGSDCIYYKETEIIIGATGEISSSPYICLGNEFNISSNPNTLLGTNTSFIWSSQDPNLIITDPSSNPTTIYAEETGNYLIELNVVNEFGCSTIITESIEAYEPDALFYSSSIGEQCKPAVINLQSINNTFINNYTWNINETTYLGDVSNTTYSSSSSYFETVFDEIASYSIELIINSIHGCSDTMLIENYIEVISPLPYFTLDPLVSCDTVYLNIIDSSNFTDSYFMDYGNGSNQDYLLNDTNQTIYTYPNNSGLESVDYIISLSADYKFCTSTFTETITIDSLVPPSPPIINYITVNSQGQVDIEWSLENEFDNINLYHQTANNPWTYIGSSNQVTPNLFSHDTLTTLINNYNAFIQDSCGNYSDSSITHSTMVLNATSNLPSRVNLSWNHYVGWDGISSYDIYRSENGAPYELYDSVLAYISSYEDSNLCNVTYGYYIIANHPNGIFQSKSNRVYIEPEFIDYTLPINLTYTTVTNNDNIVTIWDTPFISDISYYKIDRWDLFYGWIIQYALSSESPYIDTDVGVQSQNYIYRVTYKDICGNEGPTSNIGGNILLDGTQYKSHYDLSWNAYQQWDGGVLEYRILYYNNSMNLYQTIATVPNNVLNYTDSDIEKVNTENYCYRVAAINALDPNIKSYSNERCFIPTPNAYFPNAFSPNGDGTNDLFEYGGTFAKEIEINIYNRWGNNVFSSNKIDFKWDGKNQNNGDICPQGTYILSYKITGFDNSMVQDEITIFLLR